MNTLDDLRATLTREADLLEDPERYARPVAVRERVRRVRRRRRATAGAVAVAAVAAVVAGVTVVHPPEPVQPAAEVVGVDVPREVSVVGFPYRLSDTVRLDGDHRTRLRPGPQRAVSLVADGLGSGSATLYVDGVPVARAHGDEDVELPAPVGSDYATRLRVRVDGAPEGARVGLAVYESTGGLAPGVSNGDAVFRDSVAGDSLLTGAFSEAGEQDLSVRFTGALRDVRFSDYCRTSTRGLWFNVSVDGDAPFSGECKNSDPRDAGTASSSFGGGKARPHVVRIWLTRGMDGPEVAPEDGVLGLGVYRLAEPRRRVLGMEVAETVEDGGRTFRLERVVRQPGGTDGAFSTTVDTGEDDRLVGLVGRDGTVGLSWRGRLDSGASSWLGAHVGAAFSVDSLLLSGDSYRVTARSMGGGPFEGALLVYRPV